MERIVIEVEDATAKRWRLSSQQRRNEISQRINLQLAEELHNDSVEAFLKFLDEVSDMVAERGLTEEKLNEILKEDE